MMAKHEIATKFVEEIKRATDETARRTAGPIGCMEEELEKIGMHLEKGLVIKQKGEANISIKSTPWQHLKEEIELRAKKQRTRKAAEVRRLYEE